MKNIYKVYINQEFDCYKKKCFKNDYIFKGAGINKENQVKLILANDEMDANKIYHERYKVAYEKILDYHLWQYFNSDLLFWHGKYINFKNNVVVNQIDNLTFDQLQKGLSSEDFTEYLKERFPDKDVIVIG